MKTMSVKELALAFDCSESAIKRAIALLFPDLMKNGIKTKLNEIQVTAIKFEIQKHHNLVSTEQLPKTELEKELIIIQAIQFQKEKIDMLQLRCTEAERKNAILMHVSKTYTATEIAKEIGLRSAQELNDSLSEAGIQFKQNGTWVPYADYSEQGYFEIKQSVLDSGKVVYDRRITQDGRKFILNIFKNSLYEL